MSHYLYGALNTIFMIVKVQDFGCKINFKLTDVDDSSIQPDLKEEN